MRRPWRAAGSQPLPEARSLSRSKSMSESSESEEDAEDGEGGAAAACRSKT